MIIIIVIMIMITIFMSTSGSHLGPGALDRQSPSFEGAPPFGLRERQREKKGVRGFRFRGLGFRV